jgi:hypothetical protein
MAVVDVVHVVTVVNSLVAAARAVFVTGVLHVHCVQPGRVALVPMSFVQVVGMSVVEVVDVTGVLHGGVAAVRSMRMGVVTVSRMSLSCHELILSRA